MPNWLVSREDVKRTLGWTGAGRNTQVDQAIASASRDVREMTNRRFIPFIQTRSYPWPQRDGTGAVLWLDQDLQSVSALTKEGDDATAISSDDYYLEPANLGPPYSRIEIDLASSAFFGAKNTPQRAIRVTGSWGAHSETESAGTVASGLGSSASATSCVCSNGSLIDVGDTLLIETEQVFVTNKTVVDSTANLNDTLTATKNDVTVTVTDGTQLAVGEVILLNSERMLIEDISGNNLTVERAYDGSTLAAHSTGIDVYVYRTLTIQRGVNGTTAATHANATALSRYLPPEDVRNLARALAIFTLEQGRAGWSRAISGDQAVTEVRGHALKQMKEDTVKKWKRRAYASV